MRPMTLPGVAPDWADPPERQMQLIQQLPGPATKRNSPGIWSERAGRVIYG